MRVGYSLVELVVIIFIMTILSGAVVHVFFGDTSDRAISEGCLQTLRSELRALKAEARSRQMVHRVIFDSGADQLLLDRESTGAWQNYRTKSLSCDVVSTTFLNDTLIYNSKGFAFEGNDNPLTLNNALTADRIVTLRGSAGSATQVTLLVYGGLGHVD